MICREEILSGMDRLYSLLITLSFICTFMSFNFMQISGIQVADKLVILFLAYTVLIFNIDKYCKIKVIDILPLVLWIFINIISALNAQYKSVAFAFTLNYIVQVILFISFIILFSNYKIDRIKIFRNIYIIAVIIGAIGIIEYFNYELMSNVLSIFREKQYLYGRVSSLFENPNHFGTFMALSLIIGVYFLIKSKKNIPINILGNIVILIGILISGSRSALIFSILGIVILIYNLKIYTDLKIKKEFIVLTICMGMIFISSNVSELQRFGTMIDGIKSGNLEMATGKRSSIWGYALEMGKESPLFGIGNGNVQKQMENYMEQSFGTHSLYISLLVENGIIGFLAFFIFIIVTYKKSKYIKSKDLRAIFNSLSITLICTQFTEMQLANVFQTIFIFWFVFSIPYDRNREGGYYE